MMESAKVVADDVERHGPEETFQEVNEEQQAKLEEHSSFAFDEKTEGLPFCWRCIFFTFFLLSIGLVAELLISHNLSSSLRQNANQMKPEAPFGYDDSYIYERASPQECETIANGGFVDGQEEMDFQDVKILIDLTTITDETTVDMITLVSELETKVQQFIAPKLAGCVEPGNLRKLHTPVARYDVANAKIEYAEDQQGESCESTTENCHRIFIKLRLYLKDKETTDIMSLLRFIRRILAMETPLKEKFGFSGSFQRIDVIDVISDDDTPN